jgi:hypothetical protein
MLRDGLREHFAGKTVAVVGAGHSATGNLLALADMAEPGTQVHWVVRAPNPGRAYGGGDADALPARGAIGTRVRALADSGRITVHTGFFVDEITDHGLMSADGRKVEAEVIVNATGARPNHSLASELRLDLDPIRGSTRALAPLIDPNKHSCGTVPPHGVDELAHPEPGYYIVGSKSYGRAPTFLLATGYETDCVRSWPRARRRRIAARDVQPTYPKPGLLVPTSLSKRTTAARLLRPPAVEPVAVGLPPALTREVRHPSVGIQRTTFSLPAAGAAAADS